MSGWLFIVVCLIEVVLQIVSIVLLKKTSKRNYWNLILGIAIAELVFVILDYACVAVIGLKVNINGWLNSLIIGGLTLVVSTILLIVGAIMRKTLKEKKVRANSWALLIGGLVVILNMFMAIGVPSIETNIKLAMGKSRATDYVENKYGLKNCEVVDAYEEYSPSAMIGPAIGYDYELRCGQMEESFFLDLSLDLTRVREDFFLPVYYSEKMGLNYELEYDDYLKKMDYDFTEFNDFMREEISKKTVTNANKAEVEGIYRFLSLTCTDDDGLYQSYDYQVVSDNIGRIPTIDELAENVRENGGRSTPCSAVQ